MRGVRPLPRSADARPLARARRPARPDARFARAERLAVLRESLEPPMDPLAPVIEAGDALLYRREGVSEQVFRQLRRGQFRVEAELDLHGLNLAQARGALSEFIGEALARGWRVVRIVHGKGLRSGQRGPVLRQLVNGALRRVAAVLAFASAREVDGGSGACLVLLGRPRKGRGPRPR